MSHQLGRATVQTHSVSPSTSDFAPIHSPPPASPSSGFRALVVDGESHERGNLLGLSVSCDSPLSPTGSHSAEFGNALMEIYESEEETDEEVPKEGARTPVYRSSAEPLEGEFTVILAWKRSELMPNHRRFRTGGSYGSSGK